MNQFEKFVKVKTNDGGEVTRLIVLKENWNRIPLLHIYKEELTNEAPVVIFLHGFLSAKEHNLHYAYQLVEQGVRVILPDAHLHGERAVEMSETQMNLSFWKIVMKSVEEVASLHGELMKRNLLQSGKIGLAGTSMGGIVTSGCLAVYEWIRTAGICMGTTSFSKLAQHQLEQFAAQGINFPMDEKQKQDIFTLLTRYDVERKPEVFTRCPVIFWHGEQDNVVPYKMTKPFYDELEASGQVLKSTYMSEPKAGHAVSRNGMLQVTAWLAQHLA